MIIHSNELLQSSSSQNLSFGSRHQTKCVISNDVKLILTIYCKIYCYKLLKSNQRSRYKSNRALESMIELTCLLKIHVLSYAETTKDYLIFFVIWGPYANLNLTVPITLYTMSMTQKSVMHTYLCTSRWAGIQIGA